MESKLAKAVNLKYPPVAILWTDKKPEGALQFKEGRWGCVIGMLRGAAMGKTAVFDRQTFGCMGGGTGLGFGNQYENMPGGIGHFLSTGNQEFANSEMGRNIVRNMPAIEHGEGYCKTPELGYKVINALPMREVPTQYVVFKPLDAVTENETPVVIVFLANPDQLSALMVMTNYAKEPGNNVIAPFAAGCHCIGILPYQEAESDNPRAVLGLYDISVRKLVDKDVLSISVPFKLFLEMENNVAGSFLEKHVWQEVLKRNE
ncbi:MAG TPA: hypothetical protein DEF34_03500 [Desulfotomaculum sp.]|nr:MAG: hypothetical protein VR67_13620 [Peptococcaceae bacterium BRH_c8a]KJS73158.1 MAG: hypothetical protein JL56_11545 [Desulfotomaculum sp. BICA1-6]HBX22693.1 hypothetical protein [Desulfotomaculum sp.]